MKLRSISLRNFRLIEDQTINLETAGAATILVGPNNSGKTSVAEAIEAFLDYTGRGFSVDDFSVRTHAQLTAFEARCLADGDLPEPRPALPVLSMDLSVSYADTPADTNVAVALLMDLDETSTVLGLKIELTGDLNVNASWVWDYVQDPRALEDGSFPKKDDTRLVFGLGWSF